MNMKHFSIYTIINPNMWNVFSYYYIIAIFLLFSYMFHFYFYFIYSFHHNKLKVYIYILFLLNYVFYFLVYTFQNTPNNNKLLFINFIHKTVSKIYRLLYTPFLIYITFAKNLHVEDLILYLNMENLIFKIYNYTFYLIIL